MSSSLSSNAADRMVEVLAGSTALLEDVVVPVSQMPALVAGVQALSARFALPIVTVLIPTGIGPPASAPAGRHCCP